MNAILGTFRGMKGIRCGARFVEVLNRMEWRHIDREIFIVPLRTKFWTSEHLNLVVNANTQLLLNR